MRRGPQVLAGVSQVVGKTLRAQRWGSTVWDFVHPK